MMKESKRMSRVNPLAMVLQLLLDMRSVELKRENEEVKDGQFVWERRPRVMVKKRTAWTKDQHEMIETLVPTTLSYFDRLALVSKVFMDKRFLKLRRKNECLKLELFWKTYNVDMLRKEMYETHTVCNLFFCNCVSCVTNGRMLDMDDDPVMAEHFAGLPRCTECAYKEWFLDFIEEMHMDTRYGDDNDADDSEYFMIYGLKNWSFGYGSYLVDARSVCDPELRKLEWMFKILYSMRNPM
jgi:hypothetical protein